MKLRGCVSDLCVRLLEKELLPLLEKCGKTCAILLRPDDVHLIQKAVDADGMHVMICCRKELFFEEGEYHIQSRHKNFIAFGFDVTLLRRVLGAACRNGVERLEMKLTMRNVPSPGGGNPTSKPFLNFYTTGSTISIDQDLPVTKPFKPSEVDQLVSDLDGQVCPYYLDLQPDIHNLQMMVDKMKPLGSGLGFATTRSGSAHLNMAAPNVQLGAEFRNLAVLPAPDPGQEPASARGGNAEFRLKEALRRGDGSEVTLQLKHFQKCMTSSQLVRTQQLWCGIAPDNSQLHLLFVLKPLLDDGPGAEQGVELNYRLPVREER